MSQGPEFAKKGMSLASVESQATIRKNEGISRTTVSENSRGNSDCSEIH